MAHMPTHSSVSLRRQDQQDFSKLQGNAGIDVLSPGGFKERDQLRQAVSSATQDEKRLRRAANLAYRDAVRRGDRAGALNVLLGAKQNNISFGGVRPAGEARSQVIQQQGEDFITALERQRAQPAEQQEDFKDFVLKGGANARDPFQPEEFEVFDPAGLPRQAQGTGAVAQPSQASLLAPRNPGEPLAAIPGLIGSGVSGLASEAARAFKEPAGKVKDSLSSLLSDFKTGAANAAEESRKKGVEKIIEEPAKEASSSLDPNFRAKALAEIARPGFLTRAGGKAALKADKKLQESKEKLAKKALKFTSPALFASLVDEMGRQFEKRKGGVEKSAFNLLFR